MMSWIHLRQCGRGLQDRCKGRCSQWCLEVGEILDGRGFAGAFCCFVPLRVFSKQMDRCLDGEYKHQQNWYTAICYFLQVNTADPLNPETASAIPRSRHSCNEEVVKLMPKWYYRRPDMDTSHDIRYIYTLKEADLQLLVLPTMLIMFIMRIILLVPTSAGYKLILPTPSFRFSIKYILFHRFHLSIEGW